MADNNATTKILEIQVNYGDALTKIAQYRVEIDKLKEKQQQLKKQLKEGEITQEEYHKALEANKQIVSQYNGAVSVLSKQISTQLKIEKEQEGSLVQLRAKLSTLTAEYDRLSKAEREGAKGTELKDKMNQLTTEIKGLEEATQRYYRNVGNYPKTMESLGVQLDAYVVKLREMTVAQQGASPEFEEMEKKVERLRETLAAASKEGSTSLKDLGDSISNLGMGFVAWVEILDRAGLKTKDCEKTLSQMMVVITAAGTAVKLYNACQKEGTLYTNALQLKTMLLNTSLGKYIATRAAATAAETAGTTATGAASAATAVFNAVLYANPLVWFVGIVLAAVAAIYGLVKAFQYFTSSTENQKKALQAETKELAILSEQFEITRSRMEAYGKSTTEIANQTIKDLHTMYYNYIEHFEKTMKLYKKDSEEYKAAYEAKENARKEYESSLESGLKMLMKIQAEQHEWSRKEALGEYEYKRKLINEQTEQQITLAKTLLRHNKITLEEYVTMVEDLKKVQERSLAEIDKTEKEANAKKVADARKAAQDKAKAAAEAEKKRAEEYEKEFQAAQDSLANIMKEGLDKQQQLEKLSYERSMKALAEKMAKYKSMSEYDIKMRAEIQTQIEALTFAHEKRMSEFEWSEHERRIKVREEILQSELAVIKKGTEEEMQLRLESLSIQTQLSKDALQKRIKDGEITEQEGKTLLLNIERQYQMNVASISEEYEKIDVERRKAYLQNQIDSLQLAEDEKVLRQAHGYQMSEEEYAKWRSENLAEMDEHQRKILLLQEQTAQEELNALIRRGQLSTQTVEEYEAEVIAAKKKSADAQSTTNAAIVKNEQAKAQAMKSVTSSLTSLLDTLGESNEEFTKMSKIITLAQIAIDTGKALSAGIASASSMPFPANLAAIATTVATILANITTAISTVKSAKFAEGGKVTGPGTATSDSIPAMLSNGEYVMTASATRIFEPLLQVMNKIGSGVPMQVTNSYRTIESNEALAQSFETAAKEIKPVVSVVEITDAQDRVEMIESLDTY